MHPAEKLARELHNVEHSQKPGMVYQVWQDGEITLQKSGDLLWQRNLHMIAPPPAHFVSGLKFPETSGSNSFAFVGTKEEAERVRSLVEVKV